MNKEITHVCISENKHHSYSDVFASREIAKYRIGRPDGSPMKMFNISESEAISIVTTLPEELLTVVKEHYGLVEKSDIDSMIGEVALQVAQEIAPNTTLTDEQVSAILNNGGEVVEVAPDNSITLSADFLDENGDLKDFSELNVKQLKQLCKELGVTGYSDLTRDELIAAINDMVDDSDEL